MPAGCDSCTACCKIMKVRELDKPANTWCAHCAIGEGMIRKMESLGLPLDERVVRRIADGYEIHGRELSVVVRSAERGAIYTVFRGGGPVAPGGKSRGFDQHLLDAAVARGAEFLHDRVETIARTGAGGYRVALAGGRTETFDFLVGAFGVNTYAVKCATLVASAGVAGLAGGLYCWHLTYIIPATVFGLDVAIGPIVMAMVGPPGRVSTCA